VAAKRGVDRRFTGLAGGWLGSDEDGPA
jgi:hypothetical protein